MKKYLLILLSLTVLPAFAEPIAFTDVVKDGDQVLISGTVDQIFGEFPITVMVISPDGNVITFKQIEVTESLVFNMTVPLASFSVPGEYTIKAQYGTPNRVAEFLFHNEVVVEKPIETPKPIIEKPIVEKPVIETPVEIIDDTFDYSNIQYTFNGQVLNIYGTESNSIVLQVDVPEASELKITLPRAVIDSKNDHKDMAFQIFIDGEPVGYGEERTTQSRILTIGVPENSKTVEIMGTFLVPEFGHLYLILLLLVPIIIGIPTIMKAITYKEITAKEG